MDGKLLSAAVDRAIVSYTMMGMRADQERRQMLRDTVARHLREQVAKGQEDVERLVVLGLKHLVSLEDRVPERARYQTQGTFRLDR